ncbi:Tudor/PWWP/MBT superfamily protein [Striga asiatica]|uniref:Tudor/PWWP/MBT superfamily protein n=1 Tax=Striga asiatica TaxID=4170 RepID=A0A5A7R4K5_STRAF|nr:Tudor/PWWP/MBT superfamily protein [Striga asiatica]
MEDELGQGNGSGVSQSPMSENLQSEALVEKTGSENLAEETNYEEGNEDEEIMVEIVGSDVFVDGVGGNKEGDLEIGGMEEKNEHKSADILEAKDVSGEGGEKEAEKSGSGDNKKNLVVTGKNKMGKIEMGLPGSEDGQSDVLTGENKMGENEVVAEAMNVSTEEVGDLKVESDSRDENKLVVTEAMDVSSEGGGDKKVESDLKLPESRDEKNYVVTEAMDVSSEGGGDQKVKSDSRDEKNHVVPEAMDVLSEGGVDKKVEIDLKLPESRNKKNHVVTKDMDFSSEVGGDKKVESDLKLPESRDEKNHVVTEAMEVSSEVGEDKKVEIDLKLPESRDEKNHVATEGMDVSSEGGEDKKVKSDSKLPELRDEKNHVVTEDMTVSSEACEDRKVESDLKLPESRDEKNHVVTESMDVSSEGSVDKKVESDLKLPESRDEKNHVATEAIDASSEGDANRKEESELGLSNSGDEESLVVKEVCSEGDDNKEGKSELANEKDTVFKQAVDCRSGEPKNVEAGFSSVPTQEDIVTNRLVISENKTVGDETVDEKHGKDDVSSLSGDASNQDQPVLNSDLSLVASEKTDDSQIVRPDNIFNTYGEDPKNVQVDAQNKQTEIVDEKEGLAAESKGLVVKSDGSLGSDDPNVNEDSVHGMKSDPNHENESEEAATGEDFDVVLDFNDCTPDTNPDLSLAIDGDCLKSDGGLVSNTDHPDHFVSNEQTQPADEIDTDMENQPKKLEGSDGGELCENTDEKIVPEESKQTLDCEENGGGMPNPVEQSGLPQSKQHEKVEKLKIPDISDKIEPVDEKNKSGGDPHDKMDIDSEYIDEQLPSEPDKRLRTPKMKQARYFSPPENEAHHFAISDLVWGKVRNHPWWPGQIFDPSEASEKAVKHFKKDTHLVAFFGDQTFAWNEASLLKPFRPFFSQIEKQFNSAGFQHAVTCALEEVSRRVELGLSCSCIPRDKYAIIETQTVENTGIREESSKRQSLDLSSRVSCFEPDELFEYVKNLAPHASFGADRLDLTIAQSQLSSFYRFKGYRSPTVFPSSPGDLLEAEPEKLTSDLTIITYQKRKHSPKDSSNSANNEDESTCKKQKALLDPLTDVYDKRVSVYAEKVSTQTSQIPNKPSFKIGECIRRVATQLRDETVIDEHHQEKRSTGGVLSVESFSVDEMLTQLERVAREPKKRHDFVSVVHTFFMGFRNAVVQNRRARKKRAAEQAVVVGAAAEEYEFDDINDSYWTDRVVQNYSDEQNQHLNNNNCGVNGLGSVQKQAKMGRRPRKRFSYTAIADSEREDRVKRAKQESSPAELILKFVQRNNIPSEINLNKMFRRFGPLMESETEVDHENGCAKVIFKRGCDAEVARDSSERFNIFGAGLVNYQIGYEPLISVKVLPLVVPPPAPPMEDVSFNCVCTVKTIDPYCISGHKSGANS